MVPARGAKDELDKAPHAQKRRVLLSESSSTHHGRQGKTLITLTISPAVLKMTLLYSSERAFYDAILQREHPFYNRFSRGTTLVDEIYKHAKMINIASLFSVGHTHSA